MRPTGKIGVYGAKTRTLQRRLSYEAFGLTFKSANVYLYEGSRTETTPDINDIDPVFSEVADRSYNLTPIEVPIGMERFTAGKMDFSRFGILDGLSNETQFRMHIDDFQPFGRDMIIGDVFELPFYAKDGNRSFWEVTDVDLKQEAEKFIAIIYAVPMDDKRTTRDIPIDNSNSDVLADIALDINEAMNDAVKTDNQTFEEPVTVEEFDQRDDIVIDTLDNPDRTW